MKKIFIDCGTNMGMGFADLAPMYNVDHNWEVFGFEPNVYAYDEYIKNIESGRFSVLKDKNFNIQQKAVWDKNETIEFCHEAVNREEYERDPNWKRECDKVNIKYENGQGLDFIDLDLPATGGSCVKEMHDQLQRPEHHAKKLHFPETGKVEAIDFSKWVLDNFKKEDFIILKMDIEGSEYKVLPKMISDGSIGYINTLIIEWHDWMLPQFKDMTGSISTQITSAGVSINGWG
tara:strand:- start:664 stop:1362 length:699 start_codon:yes stop_codon:yes gene_type:complete